MGSNPAGLTNVKALKRNGFRAFSFSLMSMVLGCLYGVAVERPVRIVCTRQPCEDPSDLTQTAVIFRVAVFEINGAV